MKIQARAILFLLPLLFYSCGTSTSINSLDTAKAYAIGVWEGEVMDKKGTIVNRFIFRDDESYTWTMIREEALNLFGWDSDLAASKSGTWSVGKETDSETDEESFYIIVTPYEKEYLLGELIHNKLIYEGLQLQVHNFRGAPIGLQLSKME